jgi:hypothetical protein
LDLEKIIEVVWIMDDLDYKNAMRITLIIESNSDLEDVVDSLVTSVESIDSLCLMASGHYLTEEDEEDLLTVVDCPVCDEPTALLLRCNECEAVMCSNCLDDDENCYACGGDVGELEEI